MKVKLISLFAAALLLICAIAYNDTRTPQPFAPQTKAPDTGGKSFPDIVFRTHDGQSFRVQDMKEKTILVHFWAAWCAACYGEFPNLIRYVEKAHGNIGLLCVALDDRYEDSEAALAKIENKYNLSTHAPHLYWAWDEDKHVSLDDFNTVKVPETIVVSQGRMMDKIIGAGPWAEATAEK